jgi:hypothetical protein
MRHNPDRGIMTTFVERRAVPINGLKKSLGRGHVNDVLGREIKGLVAADAKIDAARRDQRLDARLDQPGFGRRRTSHEVLGQALALRDIEDGETLQERDRLRLVARLARMLALVVGREAIGIDDHGPALAFANMAAKRQRLTKSEPALARKAVLNNGAPQDQHIDAGIAAPGRGVFRHGERRLGRGRPPGLHPGHAAGLQLGDDLAGDFVIKARPVGARPAARIASRHRGSPRRAPEASPPASFPSRKSAPHSPSDGGVAGTSPQKGVCRRP